MSRDSREMRRGAAIPPMGQGLAVIGTLALFALAFAIAIGAYMVTMRVNDHRRAAAAIDQRIAAVRQDEERLRLELVIRSRFPELQRWGETLGLGTPRVAEQLASPQDLAGDAPAVAKPAAVATTPAVAHPAAVAHVSYTPTARQQLDDLIGAVAQ